MNKNKITCFAVMMLIIFGLSSLQAQITEKSEFGMFALTNATIHTVTNGTIENGTVLINGHRIEAVGTDISIPDLLIQEQDLVSSKLAPFR
jgi:hypothetical protein